MYASTLRRFRENRQRIEEEGDWIKQSDLSDITEVTIKTLRSLRRNGEIYAETVKQNDVWVSIDSIRAYCDRSNG